MSRINALAAVVAVLLTLDAMRMATGQVATDALSKKSTDGEKKTELPRNEPNWERMNQSGNAAYLANVSNVQTEMDRFKSDAYWSDALRPMLGTKYSYVGRYQKALECFDRPPGRKKKPAQLMSAEQFEPCDAVAAILELADKHRVV